MDHNDKEYFGAQYFVCAEFSSEIDWDCNERGMTIQPFYRHCDIQAVT